jgi:hypothetical protein
MNTDKLQKVIRRTGIVLGLIPLVAISTVYVLAGFNVNSHAAVNDAAKVMMFVAAYSLPLLPIAITLGLFDLGIAISKRKTK